MRYSQYFSKVSDRERILTRLADQFYSSALDKPALYVYFAAPVPGELCCCMSVRDHYWRFAWYLGPTPFGFAVREIGGPRTCDVENDKAHLIKIAANIYEDDFLEGDEYSHAQKIWKAVGGEEYGHRILGIKWDGPRAWGARRVPTVVIRKRWTDHRDRVGYQITLSAWSPRTSIKSIAEELRAKGYGDDTKFPPEPRCPNGCKSCVIFVYPSDTLKECTMCKHRWENVLAPDGFAVRT